MNGPKYLPHTVMIVNRDDLGQPFCLIQYYRGGRLTLGGNSGWNQDDSGFVGDEGPPLTNNQCEVDKQHATAEALDANRLLLRIPVNSRAVG